MTREAIQKRIQHMIERNSEILEHKKATINPSIYGEWSKGYYEGYLNALDSVLFRLEKEGGITEWHI